MTIFNMFEVFVIPVGTKHYARIAEQLIDQIAK